MNMIKKGQVNDLNYSVFNEVKYINQLFGIILKPIPKAILFLIVMNFQDCFHDHELDWLFEMQGSRTKFRVLGWTLIMLVHFPWIFWLLFITYRFIYFFEFFATEPCQVYWTNSMSLNASNSQANRFEWARC